MGEPPYNPGPPPGIAQQARADLNGHGPSPAEFHGVWTPASEIAIARVRWLLDTPIMKIPMGELTIAAGREGAAKSMFTLWLAAGVTRGGFAGELGNVPRRVIIVAREDSWAHTIVPRLMVAGADLSMVGTITALQSWSGKGYKLSLPDHLDVLDQAIAELEAALVIFDPFMSVLGDININRAGEVRSRIEPLADLAHESGTTMVGLAHFAKTEGRDAAALISGSHAFKDVARAIIAFARDEETAGIVSQVKNNLGKLPMVSGTYQMLSQMVPIEDHLMDVPYFMPGAQTRRHVEDLLDQGKAREVAKARDFLRGLFTGLGPGGMLLSKEVEDHAKHEGIAPRTLDRAREALNIKAEQHDRKWYMVMRDVAS